MQISRLVWGLVTVTVLSVSASAADLAPLTGSTVVQRQEVNEDLYLAGGSVYALAKVDGDIVAAGGNVIIESDVSGDVLAAGGNVAVRGRVDDDVRLAGGNVTLSGMIGDDALVAGGSVMLAPTATVGGRAWLTGGSVEVHGKVGKGLHAAARRVVIAGEITGDADIAAETIEIQSDAVITGRVRYRSPNEAKIDGGAKIAGGVAREEVETHRWRNAIAAGIARGAFYLNLLLTAIALYLLFPRASLNTARVIEASPWKSLGFGFAFLVATPLAILLLSLTLVGISLALIALALYFVLLFLGFLTGVLSIGDKGLELIVKDLAPTRGRRVLSIVAAFVALWIVCFIPVIGSLAIFAVLVFGLGALVLTLIRNVPRRERLER